MRLSQVALGVAARVPTLAGLGVRLWAATYWWKPRKEHWFFLALRARLQLRLRKRVRLLTGQQIYVDPYDHVGQHIISSGCYEPETVSVFQCLLTPGMIVVDVGAHVGQYTLLASSLVGDQGQVHAFEADPATFRELHRNVRLNRCCNVICNPTALSNNVGSAPFYRGDIDNIGAGSLQPVSWDSTERQIVVPLVTLDQYIQSQALGRLDLLKADVEGAELLVLQGAAQTIAHFRPHLVLEFSIHTERFGYTREAIYRQLLDWGYRVFRLETMPLRPYELLTDDAIYCNVLAVDLRRLQTLRLQDVIDLSGTARELVRSSAP